MKRNVDDHRTAFLKFFVIVALGAALLCPVASQAGELCGLNVSLYPDRYAPAGLQYLLGSPIKLMIVIKNVSDFGMNTERGFSQVDLHQSLILTNPAGKKFKYSLAARALDNPPSFFLNGKPAIPAETLSWDWARTVTIQDLGELFPMLKTTPGWYTVEVMQPFMRFGWIVEVSSLGLLGIVGHPDQCQGSIPSNPINFYVSPNLGALLQVRVLDESTGTPQGVSEVPVRMYAGSVPEDLQGLWSNGVPVLIGTTDPDGMVVWSAGLPCKPQATYTAVASYQNRYWAASFEEQAEGWASGCSTTISRQIVVGETPTLSKFSLFASSSIWIRAGAVVTKGHVGVREKSEGLWLDSGVEVSVGANAKTEQGVRIYGDTVKLWQGASVEDVYYNELQNSGTIRGKAVTPLPLPLPVPFPPFMSGVPGPRDKDVIVKDDASKPLDLAPGKYRDVKVGKNAMLKLSSGEYQFRSLYLGERSSVVCSGSAAKPTKVLINQRLHSDYKAKINAGGSAKGLRLYIASANGDIMNLLSLPKAAEIGVSNTVKANIVVPNGTLWIGAGSDITGSFIGKGLIVGIGATVNLDSAF